MPAEVLWYQSDNLLEVGELKNEVTGAYISSATVTATFVHADGDEVEGETWPVVLSYVPDSDGLYRVRIRDTIDVNPNENVIARIRAAGGDGLNKYWEVHLFVAVASL